MSKVADLYIEVEDEVKKIIMSGKEDPDCYEILFNKILRKKVRQGKKCKQMQ